MTTDTPAKCGHPLGTYDLVCAAPAGHHGGHVGPFYVPQQQESERQPEPA